MTRTRRRIRTLPLRTALAIAAAIAILGSRADQPLSGAQTAAPLDVEMRDERGRRVRLADFKGKIVLVDLWASWCADCKPAFAALDELYREYHPRGVEMVAVNVDQRRKDAEAFLRKQPHRILVTFDPRARMLEAFGAAGVPSSYLLDRQGAIRYRHSGYGPDTDALYRAQLDALLSETAR
jgi:thiol-disulfide isomerase/thioredoxin